MKHHHAILALAVLPPVVGRKACQNAQFESSIVSKSVVSRL